MRKQIAAANWKMNLTLSEGEKKLDDILAKIHELKEDRQVIFAVPSPYLQMAEKKLHNKKKYFCCCTKFLQQKVRCIHRRNFCGNAAVTQCKICCCRAQ